MHHNSYSIDTVVTYLCISLYLILLLTFEFRIYVQNHFNPHSLPLHKKMIKENNIITGIHKSNSFLFLHIYHVNFHYSNRLQGICLLWWWRNPEGRSNCCVGFNVSYTELPGTMWMRWASWSTCLETGRWVWGMFFQQIGWEWRVIAWVTSKVNVKGCALYRQVYSMQYDRLTLETGRIAVRRYFA